MSGPRVSTGTESRQDYGTPPEFIAAVERRFGPIVHDLAAHAGNHRHARYFAPPRLSMTIERNATFDVRPLVRQGALLGDVQAALASPRWVTKKGKETAEIDVPNRDPDAAAFDSFAQPWHRIDGLLWLNPEFSDIGPWAAKCAAEAQIGAEVTMLVPASVGSVWFRDHVAPHAMTYLLGARLCFDGKNPFPKDCLLAHYGAGETGFRIWDWRTNAVHGEWVPAARKEARAA